MIVISFALPEESKGLVRGLKGAKRSGSAALPVIIGTLSGRGVAVVHVGMGMDSAAKQAGCFLENNAPSIWIAAGFGGALAGDLEIGDIVVSQNFSNPDLLEHVASLPARAGTLITTREVVETAERKRDLGRHTGALAVDMETATIHRLCTARTIPVLALRAISDQAGQDLPVPAAVWFDVKKQRPRPFPLVAYLACHPGRIAPFSKIRGRREHRPRAPDRLPPGGAAADPRRGR